MHYEVVRPFRAVDRMLSQGEIVDTTGWPAIRPQQLVSLRYLRPVSTPPDSEAAPATPATPATPAARRRRAPAP